MLTLFPVLLYALAIATTTTVKAADANIEQVKPRSRKHLRGRFLHITDMHPDQHYLLGASLSSYCHRHRPRKEHVRAGYFGIPYGECDSPWTLTNLTLDYLEKEWAHNIDFVIWTGDNARHDNDNHLPRTPTEIFELNRVIAGRMEQVFKGIPVVPSIGNNDIWPHNIMSAGPNSITNEFSDIWRAFIPFSQYQVFQHGGYYTSEVIPNQLAAISLNTLYWYDSNKAVGGCVPHDEDDPGNGEFDWLEVQLDRFRERGMQVILSGHIPPGPGLYFPDCHFRYVQIALRFQDTIVAHLYGHMNIDHFFWVDVEDVMREPRIPRMRATDFEALYQRVELHNTLHKDFKYLSKLHKVHYDDYAVVNVGPSVLPEYLPSFRIFQYNTTGYEDGLSLPGHAYRATAMDTDTDGGEAHEESRRRGSKRKHGHRHPKRPNCTVEENKDRWACRPWGPRHASPDSPSRRNRLWSLLGYAQYFLPDQATGNATHPPKYKLEYLTFPLEALHPPSNVTDPDTDTDPDPDPDPSTGAGLDTDAGADTDTDTDMTRAVKPKAKAKWRPPIPRHLLPRSLRNASRTRSRFAPYRMKDLTIPRWITLARKLAKRQPMWDKFVRFMYMGEEDEENRRPRYDDDGDYDDVDVDVDVDVGDGEEDLDLDLDDERDDDGDGDGDGDGDADEEWEVPQEEQWVLPTDLRKADLP